MWIDEIKKQVEEYQIKDLLKRGFYVITYSPWDCSINGDLDKTNISKDEFTMNFKYGHQSNQAQFYTSRIYSKHLRTWIVITLTIDVPDCPVCDSAKKEIDRIFATKRQEKTP